MPTILPPADDSAPLPRVTDHDDEQVDWHAVEQEGIDFCASRERQTSPTVKPGTSDAAQG